MKREPPDGAVANPAGDGNTKVGKHQPNPPAPSGAGGTTPLCGSGRWGNRYSPVEEATDFNRWRMSRADRHRSRPRLRDAPPSRTPGSPAPRARGPSGGFPSGRVPGSHRSRSRAGPRGRRASATGRTCIEDRCADTDGACAKWGRSDSTEPSEPSVPPPSPPAYERGGTYLSVSAQLDPSTRAERRRLRPTQRRDPPAVPLATVGR